MSNNRKPAGLRRSVLDLKSRKSTGKGGWRGSWKDRFDIPKATDADILITRGSYDNPSEVDPETGEVGLAHFHTCQQHPLKLKKSGPGSFLSVRCNIDAGEENCLCCLRKEQGDNRIGIRTIFSFNILSLAIYEQVPAMRDGRPLKYEQGEKRGQPIMQWELVDKPRRLREINDDLDALIAEGKVTLVRKKYLEVGSSHQEDLSRIDELASAFCKCGGGLKPFAFECAECGTELLDIENEDLAPKEVAAYAGQRDRCTNKKCGYVGIPVPRMVCDNCNDPAPLTAFDVVATVRKEGEGTNSHITIRKVTPLDRYELPGGASLIEWEKISGVFEPVFDEDDNFVFTTDFDVKKLAESLWDFEKVHAPRDHEWLAMKGRLDCDNPFPPRPGTSKYRNYDENATRGRGRSRVDDDDDDETEDDDEPEEVEEAPARGRRTRAREPEAPARRRRG